MSSESIGSENVRRPKSSETSVAVTSYTLAQISSNLSSSDVARRCYLEGCSKFEFPVTLGEWTKDSRIEARDG
jgi:hypothetical protein